MFAGDNFDGDVYEWPSNAVGRSLKDLEGDLRCGYCGCIFTNPQGLSCGHIFCAACLQQGANLNKHKAQKCPTCRKDAMGAKEVPGVGAICEHYRVSRPLLLALANGKPLPLENELSSTSNISKKNKLSGPTTAEWKILPQPFWHGMKEKEVARLLAATGLPPAPTAAAARARYDRYRLLHNEEARQPGGPRRAPADLVRAVLMEEKVKRESEKQMKQTEKMLKGVKEEGLGSATTEMKNNFKAMAKKLKKEAKAARKRKRQGEGSKALCGIAQDTNEVSSGRISDTGLCQESRLVVKGFLAGHPHIRVVESRVEGMHFFFNTETGIGQLLSKELAREKYDKAFDDEASGLVALAGDTTHDTVICQIPREAQNQAIIIPESAARSSSNPSECAMKEVAAEIPACIAREMALTTKNQGLSDNDSKHGPACEDSNSGEVRQLRRTSTRNKQAKTFKKNIHREISQVLEDEEDGEFIPEACSDHDDDDGDEVEFVGFVQSQKTHLATTTTRKTGTITRKKGGNSVSSELQQSSSRGEEWSCWKCTFLNNAMTIRCGICSSSKLDNPANST